MRSSRPAAAVAVVGALLALAPGGALAHRHTDPRGHCRIDLNIAPRQITSGDSVIAFGHLRCTARGSAAGQAVTLFEHAVGGGVRGYTPVGSATTDARGFYEITVASVQSKALFYARANGARSGRRLVRVAAQVTLSGPPEGSQLLTGRPNQVTFTGAVSPDLVGARVILQRQNALTGNEWRRIDRGVVAPGGTFTIVHTFLVPGDANLRAIVRGRGIDVTSPSNVLTYEISQAQNSALTIDASADPIAYGQPVTISGVASGLANQPVTLLARTVRQRGFAPVAEVSTNGSGEYTFPAQSPVNSTLYQVAGGSKAAGGSTLPPCVPRRRGTCGPVAKVRSAVLYEGVKDVLTASVSQTTVQAGQALTFAGTVAPDHTGHIVYLERQNVTGGNFHVVEVATVGGGSAYAIVHKVYVPGTKVFRVRIPGGPENEGAASAPFTIQVTPAPAATLTPEGPGNSSLPSEGEQ